MSLNFENLDDWTGENLLFFSLAEPEKTTEAYKKCMHSADMVDDESYSIDEEIILYVLTQALHVPVTSLPAIILTDSLSKSQWYIFSTGVGKSNAKFQQDQANAAASNGLTNTLITAGAGNAGNI